MSLATALLTAVLLAGTPTGTPKLASVTPDFPTGILPVLTKAGCNTGACHGAAIGRGGLRLSLLGFDPEADYAALTREQGARRIDLGSADESLLLRKATMRTPHGGGMRLRAGDPAYRVVRDWIASGARYGSPVRRALRLEVAPRELFLERPGVTEPLRVSVALSDGTRRDVTAHSLYSANDDAVAEPDAVGRVTARRPGVTAVMVRCMGQVASTRIMVPHPGPPPPAPPPISFIDRAVFPELARLRLPISDLSDDVEFLRRVHLDLIGTLPSGDEARQFLLECATSTAGSPVDAEQTRMAVRGRLVDRLLAREEYVDHWTGKWADLLLIDSKRLGFEAARAYSTWLRARVRENAPLDVLARDLITAEGDPTQNGPANFYRVSTDARDTAEYVSRSLLGVRVECARCHNHPADRWTMGDYHSFAATFARTRIRDGHVVSTGEGEVDDPRTERPAVPRTLGGGAIAPDGDRRTGLAAWLCAPGNPFFARNVVNRIWRHLLGRGLVEPVDDLRETNPPIYPGLLQALTEHFTRTGFDARSLIREIVSSRTYQLTSRTRGANRLDDRLFSHALLKPLSGAVLADAIASATGVPWSFEGQPEGTRAAQLLDARVPSDSLDAFGRCRRESRCETPADPSGLALTLHLLNGPAINDRLGQGVIRTLVRGGYSNEKSVEELYFRTLSRPPERPELDHWLTVLSGAADREECLQDLLWALLNSREFAFNH